MKAIQVSFDENLLARLDEDPEVKKLGRSEVMRRAVASYLRRRRNDAIRDAYQRAYVGPDMFETYFLVMMLTAVVLVGRRILIGPLIGTAILIAQQNLLSLGGDWNKIILGSVLALVLIFWPTGLIGLFRRLSRTKA